MPSSASSTTPCGAVGCCTLAFSTEVTELPHLTLTISFPTIIFPLELFLIPSYIEHIFWELKQMGCEIRNIPCRYRARTRLIGNILWPIFGGLFLATRKSTTGRPCPSEQGRQHLLLAFPTPNLRRFGRTTRQSWKNTLSRQQGVYIITNTDNGKLYVGIATGRNGIYQRWKNYIDNGHGGNTELRKLVEQQKKRT